MHIDANRKLVGPKKFLFQSNTQTILEKKFLKSFTKIRCLQVFLVFYWLHSFSDAIVFLYCFHCIFSPKFIKLVDPQHYNENNWSDHAISIKLSTESLLIRKHLSVKKSVFSKWLFYYWPHRCFRHRLDWLEHNWETKNWFDCCVFYTEDVRSMTTFYYCSINHQSGLQSNTFSKLSYIFLIHQNVPQIMSFHLRYMMVSYFKRFWSYAGRKVGHSALAGLPI